MTAPKEYIFIQWFLTAGYIWKGSSGSSVAVNDATCLWNQVRIEMRVRVGVLKRRKGLTFAETGQELFYRFDY